jgi:hypothetical protein
MIFINREEASMQTDQGSTGISRQRVKKRDELVFKLMLLLSFPIFLAVVLSARILPAKWVPTAIDHKKSSSIFHEATSVARSTIAVALMD